MKSKLSKKSAARDACSFYDFFTKCLLAALFLAFAHLIPFASASQAQTLCVNLPGSPPGLPGPPNWYDNTIVAPTAGEFRPVVDDPRWLGSLKIPYGEGAAEQVGFRAQYGTVPSDGKRYLFLSWHIQVDPSEQNTSDRLFVGLSSGANSLGLEIQPFNSSACRNGVAPEGVTAFTRSGGTWLATATPPWAATTTGKTGVWVTNGVTMGACPAADSWAVHLRVPVTDEFMPGANIGSDFRMFYQVRMFFPDNTMVMTPYKWPRTAPDVTDLMTGEKNFNNPATDWGAFHLSTGPADAACDGAFGVSLDRYDVGTLNNYPGISPPTPAPHLILYNATTMPTNTFFVRPFNNLTGAVTTIPAGRIKARVRVANWGSVATSGPWLDIPNGLGMAATHTAPIASGTKGEINFPWALTASDIATFATGPSASDKCILVELSSATGAPGDPEVVFLNDSVYRNMTFAPASVYKKKAEINIKGLPTTSAIGPKRDVYLYVQTLNMPAPQRTRPTIAPGHTRDLIKGVGADQVKSLLAAYAAGQIDKSEFDRLMPTYRVFVYHDTGQRMTINGVTYTQLDTQPSFGYHMIHEGDLEGWRHSLQGAQEIAPNFYKIAVTNNGSAKVRTTIEAVEPGGAGSTFKRWGLSLHAGASIPHGNFSTIFDPGPNFAVDLEYRFHPLFSIEGIYGFHRFNGTTIGGFTFSDVNLHQISLNGKVYGNTSPVRPFFNFGGGAYHIMPSTRGGLNVGGGLQFDVTPNFAVEGMYNFHNIFTSGSNTKFSTVQGGVRFRF